MPTAKLIVHGLANTDAESRLERALIDVAGVYAVVASCHDQCVEVDFEDDEVTIEEITAAASAAGFTATLAG